LGEAVNFMQYVQKNHYLILPMPAWMNISPFKLENCPVLPEKITWIGWRFKN
jgi:hypothetical protein